MARPWRGPDSIRWNKRSTGLPPGPLRFLLTPAHLIRKVQLNRQKNICPATWKYNLEPGDTGLGRWGQKRQCGLGLMDETQLCTAQLSGFGEITAWACLSFPFVRWSCTSRRLWRLEIPAEAWLAEARGLTLLGQKEKTQPQAAQISGRSGPLQDCSGYPHPPTSICRLAGKQGLPLCGFPDHLTVEHHTWPASAPALMWLEGPGRSRAGR